ncbi:threonine-phosphate decarboxylase CobD [Acidocella aminolytica]|jgi:cobalamin biosynthetic protein CobC|uniref:threonine-phosphate decarboxylase n=1 Tax=Acidocella aminolytica 101 = DSM 11237 TaxID=1120923 RepID=A0A0D6PEK4_9PROT|nr:threonine-phosphate decarboxylase CobD [Acidocella aminolytica]GAN79628.1 L-threonine-O-3-phosphate decarboxylase [Acidocella aminolytica 101 = DSM 11237]GBQ34083.1 histidinol-phosphate/aromatic aminotransferase [Acidocella aminolytica 101 = DSM 11237]SHF05985.1 L-threonine O-3-phosphate decarboxylase [Acidocella aminolytica 101 = DSM 11237]
MKRDHGGNLDWAVAQYGGTRAGWVDLSTGINRQPYKVPDISPDAWTALPTASATARLIATARASYNTQGAVLPLAGAQAAIQLIPLLSKPGKARIMSPTYNEHAAALRALGWQVEEAATAADTAGADLAVIVNPNNPDGRYHDPQSLLALLPQVGRLVVDESFGDPYPDLSLTPAAGRAGLVVLRSFGKFYGLAGMRLGFALGSEADITALSQLAGPWPVCGPALEIGAAALADTQWAKASTARLMAEIARMDELAAQAGWSVVGGTCLFRLYDAPDAAAAQAKLAAHHIWSRIFPYSGTWIRLGMPGTAAEWSRLGAAMAGQ